MGQVETSMKGSTALTVDKQDLVIDVRKTRRISLYHGDCFIGDLWLGSEYVQLELRHAVLTITQEIDESKYILSLVARFDPQK